MISNYEFNKQRLRYVALKKLFEDPEFPPADKILPEECRNRSIKWMRPKQISANAKFVVDGYSRQDIKQGRLGDCWFLAALVTLTQRPNLFKKVVLLDNSLTMDYAGMFHFR